MRQPDDAAILLDISGAAETARQIIGDSMFDDYQDDLKLQFALVKLIETIGEAANKLSPDVRQAIPEIPWEDIIGMRHRLIHDYRNIDLTLVWLTAVNDLPELLAAIRPYLPSAEA